MIKWTKVLLKEKKLKNNHTTKVTTIFIKTNKNKVKGTRKCENWWKRNSLAATLCGRAHNLITAWVHRNRNWITIYFFKNIRRLNPQKKKKLQKTQLDKNPENVILCLVGEKVNAKTVATVNENRWEKKKKNFSKKSLKNRFQKTKAFCRERETRGEEEREAVLGSKEKIWSTEGEESEEESPRFFLDLANTARFTFSGLRIHDPHATGPWLDPLSSSIWKC